MRSLLNITLGSALLLGMRGIPAANTQRASEQGRDALRDSGSVHRALTQRDVARRLMSDDLGTRAEGLRLARMVRPERASRELRLGLVVALHAEAAAFQARLAARGKGERSTGVAPRPVSILHDQLLTEVIALKDSVTIPALAHSLGTGMLAIRALTGFGQGAAVAVLRVTTDTASQPECIVDGLVTLRMMVEQAPRPLHSATRARILGAAASRLRGAQEVDVLLRAIDLAVVLGDADLRETVAALAADPTEVQRRGVQSAAAISRVQQQARDRLAGIPPLPRR